MKHALSLGGRQKITISNCKTPLPEMFLIILLLRSYLRSKLRIVLHLQQYWASWNGHSKMALIPSCFGLIWSKSMIFTTRNCTNVWIEHSRLSKWNVIHFSKTEVYCDFLFLILSKLLKEAEHVFLHWIRHLSKLSLHNNL